MSDAYKASCCLSSRFPARALETVIPETVKITGDSFLIGGKLTGPRGETVTNGTLKISLIKAGEEVYSTNAPHVGGGLYQVQIDTGAIGTGDYLVKLDATYSVSTFTYPASKTVTISVLPAFYRELLKDTSELKQETASIKSSIDSIQSSIGSLSGMLNASIALSVISLLVAIVAIVFALRSKKT